MRVMVVDDHTVVRSGIRYSLLAFDDIELVAEAGGGPEALRLRAEVRSSGTWINPARRLVRDGPGRGLYIRTGWDLYKRTGQRLYECLMRNAAAHDILAAVA